MSHSVVEQEQCRTRHERIREALIQAGLVAPHTQPLTDAQPLGEDERGALAKRLGIGRALSEIILEDRR